MAGCLLAFLMSHLGIVNNKITGQFKEHYANFRHSYGKKTADHVDGN